MGTRTILLVAALLLAAGSLGWAQSSSPNLPSNPGAAPAPTPGCARCASDNAQRELTCNGLASAERAACLKHSADVLETCNRTCAK